MKRSVLLWSLAFLFTCVTAFIQRVTGPTYAFSESIVMNGKTFACKLDRSHGGMSNAPVRIATNDSSVHGTVEWKRYNSDDAWSRIVMNDSGGILSAELPYQPPAGKLLYQVLLDDGVELVPIPEKEPLVIRFKGIVPLAVLIPHIVAIFGAMLLAARTGLECFNKEPKFKKFSYWTIGLLFVGGLILGPIVQRYAFNAWWTGWPFGTDLTDNKTAVAFVAWIAAAIALRRTSHPKRWVLSAAIVSIIVFLIPHSLFGTELNYKTAEHQNPAIDRPQ